MECMGKGRRVTQSISKMVVSVILANFENSCRHNKIDTIGTCVT